MAKETKKDKITRSYERYQSYDLQVWSLEFFDEKTGGYVVVNRGRISHSKKSKKEKTKYEGELYMAKVFARDGHEIEMLDEDSRELRNDANIDGVPAEMKRIITSNNIERAAAKAKYKQNARIVLFQFDKDDERIRLDLLKLQRKGYNVLYFFTEEGKVREL